MRITSIRAWVITDPTPLGRAGASKASWHQEIDHMHPIADDPAIAGEAVRFEPKWPEALCVVELSDGTWGVGLTALGPLVTPFVNDYLAPMLVGQELQDHERLWALMDAACAAHFGHGAITRYAMSAVDLALWDARGRLEGRPVWDLLGGDASRPAISCYATGFVVVGLRRHGFEAFKLACPWGADREASLDSTREALGHARSLLGPDTPLMLDCWAVNEVDDALAIIEATAEFDLAWVEDYIRPWDVDGYDQVRRSTKAVLASGERWYSVEQFARSIDRGVVDIVQPRDGTSR